MKKIAFILFLILQITSVYTPTYSFAQSDDDEFTYKLEKSHLLYYHSFTELGYYCCLGDLEKVKELLDAGADIERAMTDEIFVAGALHCSVSVENVEIVRYLTTKGVNLNQSLGEASYTPLVAAIQHYKDREKAYTIVKILLEAGANPDGCGYMYFDDVLTFYPLIEAVKMGDVRIVKMLIDRGADFEFYNAREDHILDIASKLEDKKSAATITEMLVKAGVKQSTEQKYGKAGPNLLP